jgi:hypothetical protein
MTLLSFNVSLGPEAADGALLAVDSRLEALDLIDGGAGIKISFPSGSSTSDGRLLSRTTASSATFQRRAIEAAVSPAVAVTLVTLSFFTAGFIWG